jgi:hypothetical protein
MKVKILQEEWFLLPENGIIFPDQRGGNGDGSDPFISIPYQGYTNGSGLGIGYGYGGGQGHGDDTGYNL